MTGGARLLFPFTITFVCYSTGGGVALGGFRWWLPSHLHRVYGWEGDLRTGGCSVEAGVDDAEGFSEDGCVAGLLGGDLGGVGQDLRMKFYT